jgi:Ecdysteroid kinase-like family
LHGDCWNNNMMYAYDEVSFILESRSSEIRLFVMTRH